MDKKSRVLVIIPAYNEEKNVGRVIDKIQKIHPGADMVIGSRFLGERSYRPCWIRRRGMSIFGAIVSLVVGQRITDSSSGFRALKREVANFFTSINYPSDYQDADVIMLAHFVGFRIKEVPVIMYEDSSGRSQLGGHRLIYYGFKTLLSIMVTLLRKKPNRR